MKCAYVSCPAQLLSLNERTRTSRRQQCENWCCEGQRKGSPEGKRSERGRHKSYRDWFKTLGMNSKNADLSPSSLPRYIYRCPSESQCFHQQDEGLKHNAAPQIKLTAAALTEHWDFKGFMPRKTGFSLLFSSHNATRLCKEAIIEGWVSANQTEPTEKTRFVCYVQHSILL